jgi:hypothetical protein
VQPSAGAGSIPVHIYSGEAIRMIFLILGVLIWSGVHLIPLSGYVNPK